MCYMYVLCFSTWYVWLLLEKKKKKKTLEDNQVAIPSIAMFMRYLVP